MVNVRVTRENLVALPALAPYFILGLLSFAAVPWVLLAAAGRLDAGAYRHPLVLAAVHLYALGWGSAVALGALQQMVAVVYATVLHSTRLARAAFVPYALGLAGLITGFVALSRAGVARPALFAAAAGLPLGAMMVLANVTLTLRTAQPTARGALIRPFVHASGVYLLIAFLAGAALAVNLTTGWLLPAWRATFAAHVGAAAGGWFLMLVIGISYHLLTFFGFVDKRREFRRPAAVRRLLHAGVVLGIVAASLPSLGRGAGTPTGTPLVTGAAGLAVAAACALFVGDARGLYARRGPERMHPAVGHVRAAHAYLALCAVLLAMLACLPGAGFRPAPSWLTALGFLAAAGWLSSTILGYLHRILPFIVWHNRYWGRGREPGVPAFRDMIHQPLAWAAFAVYHAGVVGTALALVTAWPAGPFLALLGLGAALAAGNLLWTLFR